MKRGAFHPQIAAMAMMAAAYSVGATTLRRSEPPAERSAELSRLKLEMAEAKRAKRRAKALRGAP